MSVKRGLACCRHDLRRLMATPRAWAVLILTLLYLENQFAPIRQMLVAEGLTISFPAIAMYMLCDAQVTLMLGLGAVMLLFDAPFVDEAQRYLVIRAGRGSWGLGQVMYIASACAAYLVMALWMLLMLVAPYGDWSGGWSAAMEELVHYGAYEYYNTMLDYDSWLMRAYTPWGGLALTAALHVMAFALLGLALYAVNCLGRARLGFMPPMALLLWDAVMDEFFGAGMHYVSPVTLSRLTALDYGDEMGRPPVWYALVVLLALMALMGALCMRLSKRRELLL